MTSPIAPIATITPFAAPAVPSPGAAILGATTGTTTGTTTTSTSGSAIGAGGFDAALATALGGNPLASMMNSGMVDPTAVTGRLSGLAGAAQVSPTTATGAVIPATPTAPTLDLGGNNPDGLNLASSLANGFDAVQAAQHDADTLAVQAATGQLVDPAQLTVATTKAQLMTQVAAAVQSKAVTAFNTIMSMQA